MLMVWALLLSACGSPKGPLYAEGEIVGEVVKVNLDSEIAKYSLDPSDEEPAALRLHRQQLEQAVRGVPDEEELKVLIEQGSPDFASLVFARALLNEQSNRCWQNESDQLRTTLGMEQTRERLRQIFERHHALIVPGWHWQSRPETGAAMTYPRKVLRSMGLESTLVKTDEHGSVEHNGLLITQAIERAAELNQSVVIVSASKGGADTAYALGAQLDVSKTPYLIGWLNIGGIIAGSTLVDYAKDDPQHWLQWLGLSEDTPIEAILSLTTNDAEARLARLRFPNDVKIINYAALSFASTVNEKSRYSYTSLAAYGPNDGAALIPQMLVPGGNTVLEFGLDHYMRSARALQRIIALLMMIMENEAICD